MSAALKKFGLTGTNLSGTFLNRVEQQGNKFYLNQLSDKFINILLGSMEICRVLRYSTENENRS